MTVSKKKILWTGAALLLFVIAVVGWRVISGRGALPDGLIQANGRIEGDQVAISSKFGGRIAQLMVREGDTVQAGQVLAVLDDAQVKAKVAQLKAASEAYDAQIEAANTMLAMQRKELPLTISSAEAGASRADAAVDKAKATHLQAQRDTDRARELLAKNFVNRQRVEQSELATTTATAEHSAASDAALQAQKQAALAKLGVDRISVKESELAVLRAQRQQAQASLAEAESILADLTIKAPSPGIIMTRIREPGEVIAAGSPVFELVDLDRLYLKVYVPEVQIGKLRLGLPARIYSDAFPDTPFDATLRYVSSRAEFTPKEVQTPDERVKLTYAIKLYVENNPGHKLTPGLPADAVIRWKEGVEWAKPKW